MKRVLFTLALIASIVSSAMAQSAMQNVLGRECTSLNGKWAVLTDIMDKGKYSGWGNPKEPTDPLKLNELVYQGGSQLSVPGDWNSQNPELFYYEAPMWYERIFYYHPSDDNRAFLHFGAVANHATVYLNGKKLGEHKGGFTPFQFEVTDLIKDGQNEVIVRVDNRRGKNTIPALSFDWWNYGGITRDVNVITTPSTFIKDYWVRLEKGSMERVLVDVELDGEQKDGKEVVVSIKGTKISKKLKTDSEGKASINFKADLKLWSPDSPNMYEVTVESESDSIEDLIGFRCFETKGPQIMLNGKPIFLKGINIHEEIAKEKRRSTNAHDAEFLINEAKELGCNFIRLSHYPHNEYMVRLCEQNGIMMWEEIPLWQNIDFKDKEVCSTAMNMMHEMVSRDKNRCGICIWSIANETWSGEARNEFLFALADSCRSWDNTRAISSAMDGIRYKKGSKTDLVLTDPLADHVDIIGINKYMGWYQKWLAAPEDTKWYTRDDKPVIITEFGAEAIYANYGDKGNLNSWSEDYMEQAYKDDLASFEGIPNLAGTAPWILFDFRSPRRAHAMYQQGWNRKGLMSPEGDRKRAWYIMRDYYKTK